MAVVTVFARQLVVGLCIHCDETEDDCWCTMGIREYRPVTSRSVVTKVGVDAAVAWQQLEARDPAPDGGRWLGSKPPRRL